MISKLALNLFYSWWIPEYFILIFSDAKSYVEAELQPEIFRKYKMRPFILSRIQISVLNNINIQPAIFI
jgi:hypothetical protein